MPDPSPLLASGPAVPLALAALASAALAAGLLVAALRRALPPGALTSGRDARAPRRLGGLALGPLAALAATTLSPPLALALVLLWVAGTGDDWRGLPIWPRLLAQLVAGALALWALGIPVEGAVWTLALLFLVGSTNAANFTDGADLMAVAYSGVPLAGTGLVAAWAGVEAAVPLALVAGGTMLGHAWHNRPPARVFLGDGGALPLGLAIGTTVLLLWPAAGALALAPFLALFADTGLTLLHGIVAGKRVWEPHRRHLYHRALDAGVPLSVVLAAVGGTALLGLGVLAAALG